MRLFVALALAGCAPLPSAPCEKVSDLGMRLAPDGVELGAFVDGDPLPYGTPPQGGVPYTPVYADISGLAAPADGVTIEVFAVDIDDGSDLGGDSYQGRLVCANVGPSDGRWILASVHHRYYGWDLPSLEGREAELTVVVTDTQGTEAEASLVGPLEQM